MSKRTIHTFKPRPAPPIPPNLLMARHAELQQQLTDASAVWQQAEDAILSECEKPEIERDQEGIDTLHVKQVQVTRLVETTIAELKQLDGQLAPYLEQAREIYPEPGQLERVSPLVATASRFRPMRKRELN
jgi:hypothetical protein